MPGRAISADYHGGGVFSLVQRARYPGHGKRREQREERHPLEQREVADLDDGRRPEVAEIALPGDAAALQAATASAGLETRADEDWESGFFRLLLEHVEPRLVSEPSFLTHWPSPQAALAKRDAVDARAALRFELFAGGMELANAFEELTDPQEQRLRLEADMAERVRVHGPGAAWPVDDDFLAALELGMPPCAGIALGLDRLVMLVCGARRIEDVQWLPWQGN